MHHPWRRLRTLADITLRWAHLPHGELGNYDHEAQVLTLAHGQDQAQRRSTLTHELVHAERGPVAPAFVAREERTVDAIAACRLVTFDDLAAAMQWCCDPVELAEDLWVDVPTVIARLDALTPAEADELVRRLDDAELRHP